MKLSIIDMIQLFSAKSAAQATMKNPPMGYHRTRAFAEATIYSSLNASVSGYYDSGFSEDEMTERLSHEVALLLDNAQARVELEESGIALTNAQAKVDTLTAISAALASNDVTGLRLHA